MAAISLQWVKNLPAMQESQETRVQSLGQKDTLKEEMVYIYIHSLVRDSIHHVAKSLTLLEKIP